MLIKPSPRQTKLINVSFLRVGLLSKNYPVVKNMACIILNLHRFELISIEMGPLSMGPLVQTVGSQTLL